MEWLIMIELHGWVTIRETYKAVDYEEDNIHNVINHIKKEIDKLCWFKPQIKVLNGEYYIEFTLFANHQNSQTKDIFQLYKMIGKTAEGSYGLIYLHDDEDNSGKENQFQVFVLARGIVKQSNDPFLSPIIPTLEDEWFSLL